MGINEFPGRVLHGVTTLNIVFWQWDPNPTTSDPFGTRAVIGDFAAHGPLTMGLETTTQYFDYGPDHEGFYVIAYAEPTVHQSVRLIEDTGTGNTGSGTPSTNTCGTRPPPSGGVIPAAAGNACGIYWAQKLGLGPADIIVMAFPYDGGVGGGGICAGNGPIGYGTPMTYVSYIGLPYGATPGVPGVPCFSTMQDSTYLALEHEFAEVVTNPKDTVNEGWLSNGNGEIGDSWGVDNCNSAISPAPVPLTSTHSYDRQALHSNSANSGVGGCVFARGDHVTMAGSAGGNVWLSDGNGNDQIHGPSWSAWTSIGHEGASPAQNAKIAVAAEPEQGGVEHIFARDSASPVGLHHAKRSSAAGAFSWEGVSWGSPCGSLPMSDPDALSIAPGVVEVWIVCGPGSLGSTVWRRREDQTTLYAWQQFSTAGFSLASGPGASSWHDGLRRDLFFAGYLSGHLIHAYSNVAEPPSFTWEDLGLPAGGSVSSAPDAASWQQQRVDVVWRNSSNQVGHWYWDDTSPGAAYSGSNLWGGGGPGGVSLAGGPPPSIAALGDGRLNVLAGTSAGALYLSSWLDSSDYGWYHVTTGLTYGNDLGSWLPCAPASVRSDTSS